MASEWQNEPWHAVKARFATVEFWAQRTSRSAPRVIAEYKRAWASAADTEDMGGTNRRVPVSALLKKSQVKALEQLRDQALTHVYRDPTLGAFVARLVDVKSNTDPALPHLYATELEFMAAGPAEQQTSTATPTGARQTANARRDAFYAGIGGLDAIPVTSQPTATNRALAAFDGAWEDFGGQMDSFVGDEGSPEELERSFDQLSGAIDELVVVAELAADAVVDLPAEDTDLLLSLGELGDQLKAACLGMVDAARADAPGWARVLIESPQDLTILMLREYGTITEDIIDRIFERNLSTGPIDPFNLAVGLELEIPVLSDVL